MANPFIAKYVVMCGDCGEKMEPGDEVFFISNMNTCHSCADETGNVCECGSFKNEDFATCYDCAKS